MSAVRETVSFPEGEAETMAQSDGGRAAEVTSLFPVQEVSPAEPARAEPVPGALTPDQPVTQAGAIALAVGHLTIEPSPTDWTRTLTLVERTAATIRAYEKRFVQLEKQSKALADRAAEDQHRLQTHIQALEERLRQSEERVVTAETTLRDAEYHEWEADMRAKRAEQRALEAEAKCRQTEAYLRRVHELLSGVS
ncbi:hypothetical protein [Aureimonas sp. AU22]|uniref:hypothetical protein n=1 Tax=Aureimonas sp. AU22 TaxID=1638162 RepID=UPI0007859036|nr:hypothetical protein [Aureimonas sp. AU22]